MPNEPIKFNHSSFVDLFKNYIVEVPLLQRDYAYGRESEKEKRIEFLKCLKRYLQSEKSDNELDFIYGTVNEIAGDVENKKLILLDGQQRLTTLFLLHWYLALVAKSANCYDDFRKMMLNNGHSRFTYTMRDSTKDFCDCLVSLELKQKDNNGKENIIDQKDSFIDCAKGNKKLSDYIKNQKWFFTHWKSDVSIMNMLNMTDAIKDIFPPNESSQFYEKLNKSGSASSITFNIMPFKEFGLTDELYIKMNSRGRALTRFENLKTKILKLLDNTSNLQNEQYSRDEVNKFFDTRYLDVFWTIWKENKGQKTTPEIDDMFLCFIVNFCLYFMILSVKDKDSLTITNKKTVDNFIKAKNNVSYEKLIALLSSDDKKTLFALIDVLNCVSEKINNNWQQCEYFSGDGDMYFFNEKQFFKKFVFDYKDGQSNYESKALFLCYLMYLQKYKPHKNDKKSIALFKDWMRFVYNVTKNSNGLVDDAYNFSSAILGFDYILNETFGDVYKNLEKVDLSKIIVLDKHQLEEEKLKSKLFTSNTLDWRSAINEAYKKLKYFEGQLYYALIDYSKVGGTDIDDSKKFDDFNECVEKVSAIFDDNKVDGGCSFDTQLCTALLAKGNYLTEYRSNWTLYRNGGDRDISWRRFLKQGDKNNEREYFTQVIDDQCFDKNNAKDTLVQIAKNRSSDIEKWRLVIIDNLQKFKLGDNRFIRWNKKLGERDDWEIDLLCGERITSSHAEIFTYQYYLKIKNKSVATFGNAEYNFGTSIDDKPFCKYHWNHNNQDYYLEIIYDGIYDENESYKLRFVNWDKNYLEINDKKIIETLSKNGFTKENEKYLKKVYEKDLTVDIEKLGSDLNL